MKLYLRELHVHRMPGIYSPFSIKDLSLGLNVIIGPNGSGKTTVCRAVRQILWGDPTDRSSELRAIWTDENSTSTLEAHHIAGTTLWRRDGALIDMPAAAPYLADCFLLRMEDLLPAARKGDALSAEIGKELAGGFDLASIEAHPLFNPPGTIDSALKLAQEKRGKLREKVSGLRDLQNSLKNLTEQRDLLRARIEGETPMRAALEWHAARNSIQLCNEELSTLPADLELISSTDLATLQELQTAKDGMIFDGIQAQNALVRARLARDQCRVKSLIPAEKLLALQEYIHRLSALDSEIEAARRAVADAEARANDELATVSSAPAVGISAAHLDTAEQRVAEQSEARAETAGVRKAEQSIRAMLPAQLPEVQPIIDAQKCLIEWLALPSEQSKSAAANRTASIVLLLLGAIAAGAAAALYKAYVALAASALQLVVIGLLLRNTDSENAALRQNAIRRFEALKLPPPAAWTPEAVEARLNALTGELAGARLLQLTAGQADELRMLLNNREQHLQQTSRRISEFTQETGLQLESLGAIGLLRAQLRLFDARKAREAAAAQVSHLTQVRQEQIALINASIEALSPLDAVHNAAEAQAALDTIAAENNGLDKAQLAVTTQKDKALEIEERLKLASDKISDFLRLRNVHDSAQLADRISYLPQFAQLKTELDAQQRLYAHNQALLKGCEELMLREEREIAAELAGLPKARIELNELTERIAAAEAEINAAGTSDDTALAEAAVTAEIERLTYIRNRQMYASAGRYLLQKARNSESAATPGVLRTADELFQRFTGNAWKLISRYDKSGAEVAAVEQDTGQQRTPAELSGGTRVQLLMAVRIAFANQADSKSPVSSPLFLDEALANSDPERFEAAARCLQEVVNTRQVFYLTSEPEDLLRLQRSGADINIINMQQVRSLPASANMLSAALQLTELPALPSPQNHTAAEFAQMLRVPRATVTEGARALHLFYLLSDRLSVLYRLAQAGLTTVGRCNALSIEKYHRAGLTDEETRVVQTRLSIARLFAEKWSVGRPAAVDPTRLAEYGVTPALMQRAQKALEAAGGDARGMLEIMGREGNFRTATKQTIEEKLTESALLTEEQPATLDDILVYIADRTETDLAEIRTVATCLWDAVEAKQTSASE